MDKIKIAFFDSKDYDKQSFVDSNQNEEFEITYFETRLSEDTYKLAEGSDVVCVFVNDDVNSVVIDKLHKMGVKLIALRCAGYNNVDRYHGDLLQCFIQKSYIQNNNDIPSNDEEGISIIYIEGQSNNDNDIKRRERE